jgi:hypothetical protein
MMKNVLLAACVVLLLFSPVIATEPKTEWTDKESIRFAEDLFVLIEDAVNDAGPSVRVFIDSHPSRDGTWRILEFRFPDDRIVTIKVHRGLGDEQTVWLEPISISESYFEPIR